MPFVLLDRISKCEPGQRIVAEKTPRLSEEYLQDHFPNFPVMPGVLMLEAMYQASAWLLRVTDDFADSLILLKEAKNIKYSGFVKPDETLEIESELQKREGNGAWFKAQGSRDGQIVVRAKLHVETSRLDDSLPGSLAINQGIIQSLKKEFEVLYP